MQIRRILFVFGIMLTRKGGADIPEHTQEFKSLSFIFITFGLLFLLARGLWSGNWKLAQAPASAETDTVVEIGKLFFAKRAPCRPGIYDQSFSAKIR